MNGSDGELVTVACEWCDETLVRERTTAESSNSDFCSKHCYENWSSDTVHSRRSDGYTVRSAIRTLIGPSAWFDVRENFREHHDSCELCGETPTGDMDLSVHPIIPLLAGGTHEEPLLMALCDGCHKTVSTYTNRKIGDLLPDITEMD